jgi:hypothetical protein
MVIRFKLKRHRNCTSNKNNVAMLSFLSKVADAIHFQEHQIAQVNSGIFRATISFHALHKDRKRIYKLRIRAPMDVSLRNKMMSILRRREIYSFMNKHSDGKLDDFSSKSNQCIEPSTY